MSMRYHFVYGFGFDMVDLIESSALLMFIKNHKATFCKSEEEEQLLSALPSNYDPAFDLDDFFNDYPCDGSGMTGIGSVVSNIISRETGIRVEYQCGTDSYGRSYPSVLFPESLPWRLNEAEKALTLDGLTKIFKQYMNELGLETYGPDFLEIEYFG